MRAVVLTGGDNVRHRCGLIHSFESKMVEQRSGRKSGNIWVGACLGSACKDHRSLDTYSKTLG